MNAQTIDCLNVGGRFEVVVDCEARKVVKITPTGAARRSSSPRVWDPFCGRRMSLLERDAARTALAVAAFA